MSIFCVFVYGYIPLRTCVILFQFFFLYFVFFLGKSLFSSLLLFLFPRCLFLPTYVRFVFVPFVAKVSINQHKPHAFDLVVIIVAAAVVVRRNWFGYCCAVLCRECSYVCVKISFLLR